MKEKRENKAKKVSRPKTKGETKDKAESGKVDYFNKDDLANELATRWWFALPKEWPPIDYDFSKVLKENKLKLVDGNKWKSEPEVDKDGFMKVMEFENYKGVFKDG